MDCTGFFFGIPGHFCGIPWHFWGFRATSVELCVGDEGQALATRGAVTRSGTVFIYICDMNTEALLIVNTNTIYVCQDIILLSVGWYTLVKNPAR